MSAPWDLIERKSLDEISGMSRQRRWQMRKILEGKCRICGKPRTAKGTDTHCPKHAKAHNARYTRPKGKGAKKRVAA